MGKTSETWSCPYNFFHLFLFCFVYVNFVSVFPSGRKTEKELPAPASLSTRMILPHNLMIRFTLPDHFGSINSMTLRVCSSCRKQDLSVRQNIPKILYVRTRSELSGLLTQQNRLIRWEVKFLPPNSWYRNKSLHTPTEQRFPLHNKKGTAEISRHTF